MEKGALISNCSLKELNTWQCGGRCLWLAAPASVSEAASLIEIARDSSTELYVLGGGSNILVQDGLLNAGVISSAAMDSLTLREEGGAVFADSPFSRESPVPSAARSTATRERRARASPRWSSGLRRCHGTASRAAGGGMSFAGSTGARPGRSRRCS